MADVKKYVNLEGLAHYHQNISAKIDESTFSKDYEDLKNKPMIPKMSVDEITETLFIK